MAALYCAVAQTAASAVLNMGTVVSPKCTTQAQAGFKEDELDTNAITLVEEVLKMFTYIGKVIKNSTRAGGHVSFYLFNLKCASSWKEGIDNEIRKPSIKEDVWNDRDS